jgi:hypothetical protein
VSPAFVNRLLALLALALLAGCGPSVKLAYNNADTLLVWQVKRYVDLQPPQAQAVEAGVARLHAWHREQELPQVVGLLREARVAAADGLTSEEINRLLGAARARYDTLADHASADAALVLSSLTPTQRETLRQRMAEDNRRFAAEYVDADASQVRQQRAKRMVANLERVYGDLRPGQRAQVQAASAAMPLTYADRLAHRERRQRELLALLETHSSAATLHPALRRWLIDWEAGRTPGHVDRAQQALDQGVQMVVNLDRTLTPAQRRTLMARLDGYASDFSTLVAQAPGGSWQPVAALASATLPR